MPSLTTVAVLLGVCTYLEMPEKPSLEQLCADSALVVSAQAVRGTGTLEPLRGTSYTLVVFQPMEVLKGGSLLATFERSIASERAAGPGLFSVLVLTDWPFEDLLPATYVPGKRYILFLGPPCAPWVYGRARIDRIWPEQPYSDELAKQARSIIAEQASVTLRRSKSGLGYPSIPANAQEHPLPLTEYDTKNGYSRKTFYTIGDQRVGERAWWSTGKMAYEEPMRDGRREGLFRGWYPDGRLWQERFFRHGYLHGLVRQWDEQGKLGVSFWLNDGSVTEEAYLQEMQLDPSLPRIGNVASRPSGAEPASQPVYPTTTSQGRGGQ